MSYIGIPPKNIPKDSVGSEEIENASVATEDLSNNSVTFEKIDSNVAATQIEAETGTSAVKFMTPQRTRQALETYYSETKVDVFTGSDIQPGVTDTFTPSSPVGSVNNVFLFIDGVFQSQLTLNSNGDVVLSEPIPQSTNSVTMVYGILAPTGVPTDGSITISKLASGLIASQAEAEAGTLDTKLMTPLQTVNSIKENVLKQGTAQSGTGVETAFDFTNIPAGVNTIIISFYNVALSGNQPLIQLGDSGGIETTGYNSLVGLGNSSPAIFLTSSTSGFILNGGTVYGVYILNRVSGNRWCGGWAGNATDRIVTSGGTKELSGTLNQVRVTTTTGTNTFNTGSIINISYQ